MYKCTAKCAKPANDICYVHLGNCQCKYMYIYYATPNGQE